MVNNLSCLLKIDLNRYLAISPGADSDRIIVWSSTIKAHFGSKANQFTQKIRFFRYSSSVCLFNQNLSRKKKQREKKKSHFSWEIFSNLSLGRKSRRFKSFRRNQSVREDAAHFVKIERESETENRSQSDFLHSALFSESNLFKWAHLR